jgi:hypothetical protein
MGRLRWQLIIALGGLILIAAILLTQVPGPDQTSSEPVRGGTYAEAIIGILTGCCTPASSALTNRASLSRIWQRTGPSQLTD